MSATIGGDETTRPNAVSQVDVVGSRASAAVASAPATINATTTPMRPATHTNPRAVRRNTSRSGRSVKIREKATSRVT